MLDHDVLLNTLALGCAASCVAIPTGLAITSVARRHGFIGRAIGIASVALIFFPLFLHVSLWDAAFGRLGWLTSTQGEVLTPIVSGWTAATWIHGIAAAPQVALIFLLGQSTGWRSHEEQALLDANRWHVLIHVSLRRVLPVAGVAIIWVMVGCSREIAVTDIYRIETLAEQVYLGYSLGSLGSSVNTWTPEQLAAASKYEIGWSLLPFLGLALVLTSVLFRFAAPYQALDNWKPDQRVKGNLGWSLVGFLLLIMLVAVPFFNVIYRSGVEVKRIDGIAICSFSWSQVGRVLHLATTSLENEFLWSTAIASASATFIMAAVTPICWLAIRSRPWRSTYICLIATCLTIPGPLIGTLIAEAFSEVSNHWLVWLYDRTIFAPVITTTLFFFPLAAILVWYLFSRVDQNVLTNAQLDGARPLSSLWQFGIRANAFALLGCWVLIFALCFGELSASQLVLPPGIDTLPRLMLGLLHAGVDEITSGITVVMCSAIAFASLTGFWLLRKTN